MEKRAPFRAQQPIILLGSSGAFGEVHGGGWSGQLINATEPSFLSGLALVRLGDAALWPCWGPFWLWRIHPRCSGVSARVLSHTCWGHEEISFLTLSLLILMGAQSVLLVSSPGFGLFLLLSVCSIVLGLQVPPQTVCPLCVIFICFLSIQLRASAPGDPAGLLTCCILFD